MRAVLCVTNILGIYVAVISALYFVFRAMLCKLHKLKQALIFERFYTIDILSCLLAIASILVFFEITVRI